MPHVLVPFDGSPASWDALEHAVQVVEGGTITVLHAVNPLEGSYPPIDGEVLSGRARDRARQRGEELCEQARSHLESMGALESITFEAVVESGSPSRTILAFTADRDVDHIVIGCHGRSGVSRILLGSVAELVVRRAPVPVTVVR